MSGIELSCGQARALVCPGRGGLLASLRLKPAGCDPLELLWLPKDFDPAGAGFPGGGAPVLFPFAGRVWHNGELGRYVVRGEIRSMPLHGFAYERPWKVLERSESRLCLLLKDDATTRAIYPFSFTLTANYILYEDRLQCSLRVRNDAAPDGPRMPLALGMHPYFRMPLSAGASWDKCTLSAPTLEPILVTPEGAAGEGATELNFTRPVTLETKQLQSLILGQLEASRAYLGDEGAAFRLALSWEPASLINYLVLYAREASGFFCVEPWMGLPDAIANGLGLRWLRGGETLAITVGMSVEPIL